VAFFLLIQIPMQLYQAIELLKAKADSNRIAGMARFAINGNNMMGVSMPDLRAIAKQIGKDHSLAVALWETGYHEARICATLIAEQLKCSPQLMDAWTNDFATWDLCDQACSNLFIKTNFAETKVLEYVQSDREFVKRTAFSLIAYMACHYKEHPDSFFAPYLQLIKDHATDDRNFVKKAVNWALRGIGKRNKRLCDAALICSYELLETNNKTAKWIAKDAIKELEAKYNMLKD
jgi:3-methyladenine DNA glycosylase AlkD